MIGLMSFLHGFVSCVLNDVKEELLSFTEAISDCSDRISWEALLFNNELVEIISQKISTRSTSMTIIDSKEAASGPFINVLELGLRDVQDDADSVLIVVS